MWGVGVRERWRKGWFLRLCRAATPKASAVNDAWAGAKKQNPARNAAAPSAEKCGEQKANAEKGREVFIAISAAHPAAAVKDKRGKAVAGAAHESRATQAKAALAVSGAPARHRRQANAKAWA